MVYNEHLVNTVWYKWMSVYIQILYNMYVSMTNSKTGHHIAY